MARFVFQLEGVLQHRTQLERQKMRAVAETRSQMTALETELRAMDEAVQAAAKQVRDNHLTGVLDMDFLAAHRRFMNASQRQAMEVVQRLAKAKVLFDEAQKQLVEAAKQRKIIEKLREKQHARWAAEAARIEGIELDELSMQLAFRNGVEIGEEQA
jgi:flagellar FliJ protein